MVGIATLTALASTGVLPAYSQDGSIRVPKAADRPAIEGIALANPNVQKFVAGQTVKKVVVVPGRLVNLVV